MTSGLPNGVFAPYTSIPTNILLFDRSGPTKDVWYYEQPLPEGPKNPSAKEDITHHPPEQLAASILDKKQRIVQIVGRTQRLLSKQELE
jgi:type I restriction enzyme M protein